LSHGGEENARAALGTTPLLPVSPPCHEPGPKVSPAAVTGDLRSMRWRGVGRPAHNEFCAAAGGPTFSCKTPWVLHTAIAKRPGNCRSALVMDRAQLAEFMFVTDGFWTDLRHVLASKTVMSSFHKTSAMMHTDYSRSGGRFLGAALGNGEYLTPRRKGAKRSLNQEGSKDTK
jgi:hypothetical protein